MSKKDDKTNVMRVLDQKGVAYRHFSYDNMTTNAAAVAAGIGVSPAHLYKTLVTVGKSGAHYVFMVPAEETLDLKKAAKAVGEKSIEMLPQKKLLPLTGYVHGGCSPIGMKKQFFTTIHANAQDAAQITFSAGKIGRQVQCAPQALASVIRLQYADIIKEGL